MEDETKKNPRKSRRRLEKDPVHSQEESCDSSCADPCAKTNIKNVWIVGIAAIVLISIFCIAMIHGSVKSPARIPTGAQASPVNLGMEGIPPTYQMDPLVQWGMQPVALANPNCATCPNFTQCFPQAGGGAMQPVAMANPNCATCPNFTQCFPQAGSGGMQPVALANPNCATCPNFTQCFPQAAQTVALTGPASIGTQMAMAPPIFRDAVMPHEYRGVCENCHIVKADIPIPANAQMPHEYRGVCSNCHKILGTAAGVP